MMGMLFKHHEGSGFGSGRLKLETEINCFQDSLEDIKVFLKSKAGADIEDVITAPVNVTPTPPAPVDVTPAPQN
eukprot:9385841-Ditylum_brightwellii.AAC.1